MAHCSSCGYTEATPVHPPWCKYAGQPFYSVPLKGEIYCKESVMPEGQERLDGRKNNAEKPRLGLVSTIFIWAVARVLTIGAKVYGDHNWRGGMLWSWPYDAAQRHLTDWWDGKDKDSETGLSHLWHAATEIMFLIEYEARGLGKDDRYKNQDVSK